MKWPVALILASGAAWADAPSLETTAQVAETWRVDAVVGTRTLGVGLERPSSAPEHRWADGLELEFAPVDAVLEARGARSWQLVRFGRFGLTAHLGATVLATVRGPFDAGAGPHAGVVGGWSWRHASVALGAQAGTELFARGGGARVPLRATVGLGTAWGDWAIDLRARGGVDLESGLYPTYRYEAFLVLRRSWLR